MNQHYTYAKIFMYGYIRILVHLFVNHDGGLESAEGLAECVRGRNQWIYPDKVYIWV
jgi:hypothetical protein